MNLKTDFANSLKTVGTMLKELQAFVKNIHVGAWISLASFDTKEIYKQQQHDTKKFHRQIGANLSAHV